MEPITSTIITALAVNYFSHLTAPKVEKFFKKAIELKPDLENRLKNANDSKQVESILDETLNVIEAAAGTGAIDIIGYEVVMQAIKAIKFDHEHGKVNLNGAILNAPKITTGSTDKSSTGQTVITNTSMSTGGTAISVGKGAQIRISGNASIKQS